MKKNWIKNKQKILTVIGSAVLLILFFICFIVFVPVNPSSHDTIVYAVKKGSSDSQIANDLQKLGLIRSGYFFRFYAILSFQHSILKAGQYNLSPKDSIYQIARKMAQGQVIKDEVVILEGWTLKGISNYLESKGVCGKDEFITLAQNDYSGDFSFLSDKPKKLSLEGYLFPDTYQISDDETCQDVLTLMLANFDKKLTPDIRAAIKKQKKSIFDIVTMASMIEKEVRTIDDKKIVSGILWKRIAIGMPLQLDCTINYITNGNSPSVSIKNTKIDSPYNTYVYPGLPKGPISSPGMSSINAAIYPKKTNYWYWLSDGVTHFSETLEQHNSAKATYLGT